MTITRRHFLKTSLTSTAAASLGLSACLSSKAGSEPEKRQKILILGGTGFLGPALIDEIVARGHQLTLFNSGRTEGRRAAAGLPSVVPEGVEQLIGNRDPEKTADDRRLAGDPDLESKRDPASPKGLTQLAGRSWDAVIDTSGYFPRMVRASAELLADHVDLYVFISSISVYRRNDVPGLDETGELVTLEDPTVEEFGENFVNYGGGKALCEAAAEAALPGRATNIRPGYIVGRRDTSRRFLYWPWRVAQGGEMIVPGTPEDPIQVIDVRDLAAWIAHCVEQRIAGEFNATGPAEELTMQAMLEGCRTAAGTETSFTWADPEFVVEKGLYLPLWVPPTGETAGFHRTGIARAIAAGLTFRPIEDTAADTLRWFESLDAERQEAVLPPDQREKEAAALEAWNSRS